MACIYGKKYYKEVLASLGIDRGLPNSRRRPTNFKGRLCGYFCGWSTAPHPTPPHTSDWPPPLPTDCHVAWKCSLITLIEPGEVINPCITKHGLMVSLGLNWVIKLWFWAVLKQVDAPGSMEPQVQPLPVVGASAPWCWQRRRGWGKAESWKRATTSVRARKAEARGGLSRECKSLERD